MRQLSHGKVFGDVSRIPVGRVVRRSAHIKILIVVQHLGMLITLDERRKVSGGKHGGVLHRQVTHEAIVTHIPNRLHLSILLGNALPPRLMLLGIGKQFVRFAGCILKNPEHKLHLHIAASQVPLAGREAVAVCHPTHAVQGNIHLSGHIRHKIRKVVLLFALSKILMGIKLAV